jgi:hypothetical protein
MARWKASTNGPIEPPEWYRNYHPEAWDEMDAQEQSMFDGSPNWRPWPDYLHKIHSHRRWNEAKFRYRQENPAFGTQSFNDLMTSFRERHPGY